MRVDGWVGEAGGGEVLTAQSRGVLDNKNHFRFETVHLRENTI
jgi:hypothetical protein